MTPALVGGSRPRLAPAREDRRTVLLAARDGAALDGLPPSAGAWPVSAGTRCSITQAVESEALLADAVAATRAQRDDLASAGVTASAAAFVSRAFGPDMARLALTHDADVMVVDAELGAEGSVPEDLALLLERSPCDVALLAGSAPPSFADGIAVPFAGGDHDWAAAELGAWLAAGASARLRLIGVSGRGDAADASRLLASASIAIQQLVGIDVEPVLADAGPDGLVAAASSAGRRRRRAVAALAARGPRRVAARAAPGRLADAPRAPRRASRRPRAARAAHPVHLDDRRGRLISRAGRARRGRRS